MCGVFGWLKRGALLEATEITAARIAVKSLEHRGPDGEGEWVSGNLFMGHRRLNIIDLSAAAAQPFHDAGGRYVLSFNGEIYNYIELREELSGLGHRFRTKSDTEVMLAAFGSWGKAALRRLDGMFAGALHDRKTGRHLLFRDSLGQKPLYYFCGKDAVIYSSELRGLLCLPGFDWRIDREAFYRYVANAYYAWDSTPIVGVRKLLPGCLLEIDEDGAVRTERWWESIPGRDQLDIGLGEAATEFGRLFDRSCAISMRSDVPFGLFLSGGIDSSLVLESCHRSNSDVSSFNVGMTEADYDESGKAAAVARHIGIDNHTTYRLDEARIRDTIDDFFQNLDEPHGDPGFVNALFLARSCRSEITVALAGDGADELFCGYIPFRGLAAEPLLKNAPRALIGAGRAMAGLVPAGDSYVGFQFKARSYLQAFPSAPGTRYALWLATLSSEELAALLPRAGARFFSRNGEPGTLCDFAAELLEPLAEMSGIQRLLYFYQKVFLPEFVCHHTDRAAMRCSLEVRSPFLSVPLIEFANRLPDRLKMQGLQLKRVLRETMRNRGFRHDIVKQRKQGFTFPLARWQKTILRPRIEALIDDAGDWSDGEVDRVELRRLWEDHISGRYNNYRVIFNLLVFAAWRRNYPAMRFA